MYMIRLETACIMTLMQEWSFQPARGDSHGEKTELERYPFPGITAGDG